MEGTSKGVPFFAITIDKYKYFLYKNICSLFVSILIRIEQYKYIIYLYLPKFYVVIIDYHGNNKIRESDNGHKSREDVTCRT